MKRHIRSSKKVLYSMLLSAVVTCTLQAGCQDCTCPIVTSNRASSSLDDTYFILKGKAQSKRSLLDKYTLSSRQVYPSERFNVDIQINKQKGVEQYIFYDRENQTSNTYLLKDGELVNSYIKDSDYKHPYSYLYKSTSKVVFPDMDKVYYSRVSLYDDVIHIHQLNTGKFSYNNCAPSSIAMVYNWANSLTGSDRMTAEYIRDHYPAENTKVEPGYKINEIDKIYTSLGLEHSVSGYYTSAESMLCYLNEGKIINIVIDSTKIPKGDISSNINKSYNSGGGHSIICTGYLYVCVDDGTEKGREKLYLEIVDPAESQEGLRYYDVEAFNRMLWEVNSKYIVIDYKGGVNFEG